MEGGVNFRSHILGGPGVNQSTCKGESPGVEEAETMGGTKEDEDCEYFICKGKFLRQIVALS